MNRTLEIDGRRARTVACNLCGSNLKEYLFNKHNFDYVRCLSCGLVYVTPQLTEQEIEKIYRDLYEKKHGDTGSSEGSLQKRYEKLLNKIHAYRRKKKILEVGCFQGNFLAAAKGKDWEVFGTEISEPAIRYAECKYQIKLHKGAVEAANFPSGFFDVVVLRDVIEHLPDPVGTLGELNRILRPEGLLYIWTPNFDSFTRKFLLGSNWGAVIFPWHFYYFTPRTIKRLLNAGGFAVRKLVCYNVLYDRFDPYLALQNPSKYRPIRTKRWHRKILRAVANKGFNIILKNLSKMGFYIGGQMEVFAQKEVPE